jgi:hypothetical protein
MNVLERLFDTIFVSLIVFPEFFEAPDDRLIFDDASSLIVDELEVELRWYTEQLDFPYIRPSMSREYALLLATSRMQFIKRYLNEVKRACMCGTNFVCL